MLNKDEDGRIPLTGREYNALRCVIVAWNELDACSEALHERLNTIPHGWRDMRLAQSLITKLKNELYETIPYRKLRGIQTEIHNSRIVLTVKGADRRIQDGVTYIDQESFVRIINRCIAMDCWCCEKRGKDVKRCEILRLVTDILHYESDPGECPKDGCELQGVSYITLEE